MNTTNSIIAVLPETTTNVPQYLGSSRLIVTMMTGNANFPAPTPPLSEVSTQLDTLEACEELARKGGKGTTEARNVALRKSHSEMRLLRAYVQNTADKSPAQAAAIIESAGMKVGKPRTVTKLPLAAKQGNASGAVTLEAKAVQRPVQYHWQMSADTTTWTDLPHTFTSKTEASGLTPATIYSFRMRTVTRSGASEWSPPVSIIAH